MAKDVNIKIKARGAAETERQFGRVSRAAKQTGTKTQEGGRQASKGLGLIGAAIAKLVGPLGFAALVAVALKASTAIASFFDDLKTKSDEAVQKAGEVRQAYEDLFEAMGAFDEQSRQQTVKGVTKLLGGVGVSKDVGLPIVNAYARQFRGQVDSGQITEEQYSKGLVGMLGYGARHGGAATPDLVQLMAGWGMNTPEQQGAFRRMIATGAAKAGLTDPDVIDALARSMPTIRAMNWTPQQAIENVAAIASGQAGRLKKSLPATTFQALMAPNVSDLEDQDVSDEITQDPQQIFKYLQNRRQGMAQKDFVRLLTEVYGIQAATGVYKLMATDTADIRETLDRAKGAGGLAAEIQEERDRLGTLEARDAKAKAARDFYDMMITEREQYQEDVREIGEGYKKVLERREPVGTFFRNKFLPKQSEKEYAAFRAWRDALSKEEEAAIFEERRHPQAYQSENLMLLKEWHGMSPHEQFGALTDSPTGTVINSTTNYITEYNYRPIGSSDERGPRFPPGIH